MGMADFHNTHPFSKEYVEAIIRWRYADVKVNDVVEWFEFTNAITKNARVIYFGFVIVGDASDLLQLALFDNGQEFGNSGASNNIFPHPLIFDQLVSGNNSRFQFHGFKITIDTVPAPQGYTPPQPPVVMDEIAFWHALDPTLTPNNAIKFWGMSPTGFWFVQNTTAGIFGTVNANGDINMVYGSSAVNGNWEMQPCTETGVPVGVPIVCAVFDNQVRLGYTFSNWVDDPGFKHWFGSLSYPDFNDGYDDASGIVVDGSGVPVVGASVVVTGNTIEIIVPDAAFATCDVLLRSIYNGASTVNGLYFSITNPVVPPIGAVTVNQQLNGVDVGAANAVGAITNCTKVNNHLLSVTDTNNQMVYGTALRGLDGNFNNDYSYSMTGANLVSVVPTIVGVPPNHNWAVQVTADAYSLAAANINFVQKYISLTFHFNINSGASGNLQLWLNGVLYQDFGSSPSANTLIRVPASASVQVLCIPTFGSKVTMEVENTNTSTVLYSVTGITANGDYTWGTGVYPDAFEITATLNP